MITNVCAYDVMLRLIDDTVTPFGMGTVDTNGQTMQKSKECYDRVEDTLATIEGVLQQLHGRFKNAQGLEGALF